jgi:hypothetical protein
LADAIASGDVERCKRQMLKVLGDFPSEMKRAVEGH